MPQRSARLAHVLCALGMPTAFAAADAADAGSAVTLRTTVTAGTLVRTSSPKPAQYALLPSTVVPGAPPGQLLGHTGGANLNFASGRPFSSVAKATVELDFDRPGWGGRAVLSAWHDETLSRQRARYGNYPNRFRPDTPLDDAGFDRSARFSGAQWREVLVHGTLPLGPGEARLRAGRLLLRLGADPLLPHGLASLANPADLPGQQRPGALPSEERVPLGVVDLQYQYAGWTVQGFVPWEAPRVRLPGCGTFFDVSSGVPPGCDFTGVLPAPLPGTPVATLDALTERQVLDSGFYIHRLPDGRARPRGQFGLVLRHRPTAFDGEVSAYALRLHAALPVLRMQVENVDGRTLPAGVAGALQRLSHPDGLRYAVHHPPGVRTLGLSVQARPHPAVRAYGEMILRLDQPLAQNTNDVFAAFLLRSPTSLLNLQRAVLAVPAGGTYDAYDRFKVLQLIAGASATLGPALGADGFRLGVEWGLMHVRHLPDPQLMRYGRSIAYGNAPHRVNGQLTACSEAQPGLTGVPGKTCTTEGFVTTNASGVRSRFAAVYRDALWGATLTPSLGLGIDLFGYSHDGVFVNGRVTARLGLRAEWRGGAFLDLQHTHHSGGAYNLLADRSHIGLVGGLVF